MATEFYSAETGQLVTETALIKVNPVNDLDVRRLHEEALKLQSYALSMVVADVGTAKMATDDLAALAKLKKAIEQKRKEWIDPISTHLAEVNQAFKSFTAPLEEADKLLRGKIISYKQAEEERARKVDEANRLMHKAARMQAEASGTGEISTEIVFAAPVEVPAKTIASNMGSSTTVKTWHYRVVDFAALTDPYKIENVALLNAMAKQINKTGMPNVPGVEWYQEENIRINTRGE